MKTALSQILAEEGLVEKQGMLAVSESYWAMDMLEKLGRVTVLPSSGDDVKFHVALPVGSFRISGFFYKGKFKFRVVMDKDITGELDISAARPVQEAGANIIRTLLR